ncbi:hypothetical protein [uncultured Roseobacter sp.]|uniref:hypothetical protein n=1 Tax=uncultured Roseobacter sp. TaxID=114847 RepID=UPI00261CD3BC|nr:hypothetical protein [uncultured Roseobacter sp.]
MTISIQKTRTVLLGLSLVAVAACSDEPVGSELNGGNFGNATLHNQLVQTCKSSGGGKYGGAARDPLVVLDPSSTPATPVYRVHCSGQLDGKYALINYREYIASATQKGTTEEAQAAQ